MGMQEEGRHGKADRNRESGRGRDRFARFAKAASQAAGRPGAFVTASLIVIGWAALGPVFGFSDTWQLVINTGTTIITFLMVFVIQNTQNRDSEAIQVKLDELLRTLGGSLALLDLEEIDSKTLARIHERYEKLATDSRENGSEENPPEPGGKRGGKASRRAAGGQHPAARPTGSPKEPRSRSDRPAQP